MKTAHIIGLGVLLSLGVVACAAKTEPSDGSQGAGKQANSTGSSSPTDPPPPAAPTTSPTTPAPTTPPGTVAGCTPLATHGTADPASVYCIELGYADDLTTGACTFPDGTSCDQWDFYNGKCGQAHSFCNQHGGSIANTTENMGTWTATYAVCTMPDGSSCQEREFSTTCSCE